MRACLVRETDLTLDATTRPGRPVLGSFTCTPVVDPARQEPLGVTLLMNETDG